MRKDFLKGLSDGLPIGLGYFSVAFGFGIMAVGAKISAFFAWLISASNMTSAGQAAGVEIIAAGGTLIEMALSQLVINLRYSLMGFSLTQKLDQSFTTPKRLIFSCCITDEVYAAAISHKGRISTFIGWTSGSLVGAFASQLLPDFISAVMGIMLYGMFIAVFVPAARKSRPILLAVLLASAASLIFRYLLTFVSSGFAIILSALLASAVCGALFPVKEDDEK